MSVARSSSGMLTIGRIAYRRGDGSAQRAVKRNLRLADQLSTPVSFFQCPSSLFLKPLTGVASVTTCARQFAPFIHGA